MMWSLLCAADGSPGLTELAHETHRRPIAQPGRRSLDEQQRQKDQDQQQDERDDKQRDGRTHTVVGLRSRTDRTLAEDEHRQLVFELSHLIRGHIDGRVHRAHLGRNQVRRVHVHVVLSRRQRNVVDAPHGIRILVTVDLDRYTVMLTEPANNLYCGKIGAGERIRTVDLYLGKVSL